MEAIHLFFLLMGLWPWLLLSVTGLWFLHWLWTRWPPLEVRPLREVPLWRGIDVLLCFILYILYSSSMALAVQGLEVSEAIRNFLGFLLSNGVACLAIILYVRLVQRQSAGALGLGRSSLRHLLPVVLLGLLSFVPIQVVHGIWQLALSSILGGAPDEQRSVELFRSVASHGDSFELFCLTFTAAVGAPVCEEILFRGFLFGMLRSRSGFAPAAIVSSVIFAWMHLAVSASLPLAVVGFCLCYVYERTASLYYAMLFHSLFNGAQLTLMLLSS